MRKLLRLLILILVSCSVFEARGSKLESEPAGPLQSLTKDPLTLIFAHADVESASKVRLVCNKWRKAADSMDPAVHPYFITMAALDDYFANGPQPEKLDVLAVFRSAHIDKTKFFERLECYIQTLFLNNAVKKELHHFLRLINAYTFKRVYGPPQTRWLMMIGHHCCLERAMYVRRSQKSPEKARQLHMIAMMTGMATFAEQAYDFHRDLFNPDAEKMLDDFVQLNGPSLVFMKPNPVETLPDPLMLERRTPDMIEERKVEVAQIRQIYQRKLDNYAYHTGRPHLIGGQYAHAPIIINSWSAFFKSILDIVRVFLRDGG